MQNSSKKWFGIQLQDAIQKIGKKKLKLGLPARALLIALGKYADKNGQCHPLTSQLEDATGICASNHCKYFKILKNRNLIKIRRTYNKEKRMTRNYYTVNLDVILSLSIDQNTGEIKIENACINNEPSVNNTSRSNFDKPQENPYGIRDGMPCSNIEPTVRDTTLKLTQKATTQKTTTLRAFVQDEALDENNSLVPFNSDRGFEDFWACYPRKEKKKEAHKIWVRQKLERIGGEIIEDVRQRQVKHDRWADRAYIPLPTTYLNGEQWTDEIIEIEKGVRDAKGKRQESGIPHAGNIVGYAEQVKRAGERLFNRSNHPMQDNLGRKVDEKF